MDIEKREKDMEAIRTRVMQFIAKYPDKQPYFNHILLLENMNQKTLEDLILFNQVSAKV